MILACNTRNIGTLFKTKKNENNSNIFSCINNGENKKNNMNICNPHCGTQFFDFFFKKKQQMQKKKRSNSNFKV